MTRHILALPTPFLDIFTAWSARRIAMHDAMTSGQEELADHMAHMEPVDTDWLLPCPQRNPED